MALNWISVVTTRKNKRIWELHRVQRRFLLYRSSLDWKQCRQSTIKVLDRTMTSLRKNRLDETYNEVFFQKEKDGIIERLKIQPEEFEKFIWIPHRPVIKNTEQVTIKIRPVFNCSLKTHGNCSLKWNCLSWNQFN